MSGPPGLVNAATPGRSGGPGAAIQELDAEQDIAARLQPRPAPHPLTRRRQASRRLSILDSGVTDPLATEQAAWRDQHDLRMARAGLAAGWQLERARRLWSEGLR
jgi:hypothetical protein